MEENKYIIGKRNAHKTKSDRKLFVQNKIRMYKDEEEEITAELRRDEKVIADLEVLQSRLEDRRKHMELAKQLMAHADTDGLEKALDTFMQAKSDIAKIEAEMRTVYYAK